MSTKQKTSSKPMQFQKPLVNLMWFTRIILVLMIMASANMLIWTLSRLPLLYGTFDILFIITCVILLFFVVPKVKYRKRWAVITMLIFFIVTIVLYLFDFIITGIAIMGFGVYAYMFFRNRKKFI